MKCTFPFKMILMYVNSDKSGTVQNYIIKKCEQLASERIDYIKRYASPVEIEEIPVICINIRNIEYGS